MEVPSGQGVLAIRDADETQSLGVPTTITGTVDEDTGVISGAALSTPPVEFDTTAEGLAVRVKATFSQVTPNAGTGSVNGDGKVVLRDTVRVTLDLDIGANHWIQKCETSPVQLELLSTDVYSQETGGTLVDPNFTVPAVPTSATCAAPVASGVNNLLQGSGHSLSLFIKGDLPLPDPGEPTTTTLSVAPSGGSIRGAAVTLTAAVAPTQANVLDPTGVVLFKDGTRTIGSAELAPDGTAALTTSDLRPGDRSLTAEYQGDSDFAGSTSTAVPYSVAPAPIITGTFPEYITRGAAPVEFDLTVDNTGSPRPITDARVDIIVPGLNGGNLVLQRQLPDDSWVGVPLPHSFAAGGLAGTLGPAEGASVPANAVQTYRLRISSPNSAPVLAARIDFTLVAVDPDLDPDPKVTASAWPFNIVLAARTATQTSVRVYDAGIRPGQTLYIDATVMAGGDVANTGEVEFLIDGKVVSFRSPSPFGPLAPKQTRGSISSGYTFGEVDVPADLSSGPHLVSVRYLGDASYLPSTPQGLPGAEDGSGPFVLQVLDPLGPLYTCDYVTVSASQIGAYVQAFVRLPAYAEDGEELDLADVEVTVIPGGLTTTGLLPQLATAPGFGVDHIEIDLGAAGTIEGDGLVYEPDDDTSDQFLRLQNLAGTIVVDGEPGEVMALPIEQILMTGIDTIGSPFTFTCLPQAEPVILDEVGIAGVSLDVATTTDPVRVGDPVALTATASPAMASGLVEFFSGSVSLGTASGAAGTATLTVDDLPEGTNFLMARYTGVSGSPYQSEIVRLEVLPGVECASFAEEGHGATVRLVYLELLGRCPDQGGFDHWKSRLAGGTSPSAFARSIAGTAEAVGRVVDDAYQAMLGRAPDSAGRAFWIKRLQANGRYDNLLADLGASGEFWAKAGSTRGGFVTRVYERVLGRAPDAGGLDYWVGRLDAGASRRALILSLANQAEPLGRLVAASYDEILGRAPSTSERTDGIAFLRSTGDRSALYAELIGNSEFATRAQGFPNPED